CPHPREAPCGRGGVQYRVDLGGPQAQGGQGDRRRQRWNADGDQVGPGGGRRGGGGLRFGERGVVELTAIQRLNATVPWFQLKGVTKVYGEGESEVRALDGIDLSIYAGEFVSVMGTSGSGK